MKHSKFPDTVEISVFQRAGGRFEWRVERGETTLASGFAGSVEQARADGRAAIFEKDSLARSLLA